MSEEFNLSEKIEDLTGFGICGRDNDYIPKKDVKQFINKVKSEVKNENEALRKNNTIWQISQDELNDKWEETINHIIDKLAGDKLNQEQKENDK